jgi:carbonic anhydrase
MGITNRPSISETPEKLTSPPLEFDYKPSPLHIVDNGHTIMVNYKAGSSMSVGGKKYALKQFHFHKPSEEKINGKRQFCLRTATTILLSVNFGATCLKRRT